MTGEIKIAPETVVVNLEENPNLDSMYTVLASVWRGLNTAEATRLIQTIAALELGIESTIERVKLTRTQNQIYVTIQYHNKEHGHAELTYSAAKDSDTLCIWY